MGARIRSVTDFLAGLMFFGFGAAAIFIGRDYPLGTAMRMGPGYFPAILGALLVLLGLAILVRAVVGAAAPPPSFSFKSLAVILASIAAFALTVERLGIIAAVVLVVAGERPGERALPLAGGAAAGTDHGRAGRGTVHQGARTALSAGAVLMELLSNLELGFGVALTWAERRLVPAGCGAGHPGRGIAGNRPGCHHRHAAAGDLPPLARLQR